jgi:hypothetical protein
LARLDEIDQVLGSWFRKTNSKAAARTPVALDVESLDRLLAQGVNRLDVGGEVIEELGFSFGLWNRARPPVGLSGLVGAYPSFQGVVNRIVFNFPSPRPSSRPSSRLGSPTGPPGRRLHCATRRTMCPGGRWSGG